LSTIIDLAEYAAEVEAFAALATDFVDKSSSITLAEMLSTLRRGIQFGHPEWCWQTRKNIVFRSSRAYDGPGRNFDDTWLELSFNCKFTRPKKVKRKVTVWQIANSATHIRIRRDTDVLPFHFDYKNLGQWGPQLHFQVSEELGNLPIPRILSGAFLPTDCADLVLSELHHDDWRRHQAAGASSRNMSTMRDGQEHRTMSYLRNIASLWQGDRRATRVCMLQDYTSTHPALPGHSGRLPAKSW
jgi:hypothetical protein